MKPFLDEHSFILYSLIGHEAGAEHRGNGDSVRETVHCGLFCSSKRRSFTSTPRTRREFLELVGCLGRLQGTFCNGTDNLPAFPR